MRLSEAIAGYILAKSADGYSPHTLADYRLHLRRLVAYLEDPELGDVAIGDLRRFFVHLRENQRRPDGEPLAESTLSNAWCAIRSLFRWAHTELGLPRPDLALSRPRYTHRQTEPFTEDEVRRLIQAAKFSAIAQTTERRAFRMRRPTGRRDVALVLLLLDTGLRVSECARLTIGAVHLDTGAVTVLSHRTGIKSRPRIVYLGKRARRALWSYLSTREPAAADDPLFVASNHAMDRNAIGRIVANLGKRANVHPCSPHRFRHTAAVCFLRNGGDALTLQRMLGHTTLDTVKRYVALADADMAAVHRRASPADNWRLRPSGGRGGIQL